MKFNEHFTTIGTIKTFYIEAGEGTPLIFIHGWGARSYSYKETLALLSQKYHVFALDLPGFGRSETPAKLWDFGDYAEFTSAFIEQISKDNVILVGHSLGGGVALYTATKNQKISQLILIDAAGQPLERRRIGLYSLFMVRLFQEMLHPKYWVKSLDLSLNFLFNVSHFTYIIPFTLKIFAHKVASDPSVFSNVKCKTLILWGRKDTIFGKGIEERLTKSIPKARLEYIDGTHNWIIFTPDHITHYL